MTTNEELLKRVEEFVRERDNLKVQRDQVLHLLSGGTLTEQQVQESGLGHGVLSEQNHHEHMRCKAEKERDEEKAIVNRVWSALRIETYEQAKPFAIHEHVEHLIKERDEAQAALIKSVVEIDNAENRIDEQWLGAIGKKWLELTGKYWETRDGEWREEGLQANVGALFEHIEEITQERNEARAACAVMREALAYTLIHNHADNNRSMRTCLGHECHVCDEINKALAKAKAVLR